MDVSSLWSVTSPTSSAPEANRATSVVEDFEKGILGSPGEIRTLVGGSKARHACPATPPGFFATPLSKYFSKKLGNNLNAHGKLIFIEDEF